MAGRWPGLMTGCVSAISIFLASIMAASAGEPRTAVVRESPLPIRGYYFTLMRMPTFGLNVWKSIVDDVSEDGGNTIILWTAGGFRSRQFPETWKYNSDHANVREEFLHELIDYAHVRRIKVLLGFTPFGYDGVNRMAEANPGWQALGPDQKPTAPFGIHSWGQNLCPGRDETQQFMRDYVLEMLFDFYPNADGLFIESSDYAVCHCPRCGAKFFDNEFRLVREVSDRVWAKMPDARIVVYPHYFTGLPVQGFNIAGAKQEFDSRWTVFFTPHSAPPNRELIGKAADSIWWDDSPALRTPTEIRQGVRKAIELGCSGYIPSLESFSFVATNAEEGQTWLVGKRQQPFGFGWLQPSESPYREIPVRINRLAYRAYSQNPELTELQFRQALATSLCTNASDQPESLRQQIVDDVLFLQSVFNTRRSWCQPGLLASPERVEVLVRQNQLDEQTRTLLRDQLDHVRHLKERYRGNTPVEAELSTIAAWLLAKWPAKSEEILQRNE